MAKWGSSALAGSLSSDGVTIKILVVIQPYTYQPFLWDVTNKQIIRGNLNCLWEMWCSPSPLAQRSCRRLILVLEYQSWKKLLPFILDEKQKQEYQRTLGEVGEKWIHKCIGMFIKGREKRGQKRDWRNSAWFVDREGSVGNWWKISNDLNKNDQVQRLGNKYRNKNNQEKNRQWR